jgi:aminoglycoside phosphotransferase (APT) family kinase protein
LPPAGVSAVAGGAFEAYLDGVLPAGDRARVTRIGEGSSNLTFLVERGGARVVLRRPPPPPLPPSAHDVVREARLQLALAEQGVRVPRVLAVCEDPEPIGAPFYLMEALDGTVIGDAVPAGTDGRALGLAVVDALAELHAVDRNAEALRRFGRPSGYLERQLDRFSALYAAGHGRRTPGFEPLTERLRRELPGSGDTTVVHGDYRLGNVMVTTGPRPDLLAILDWEMATVGDPLADLGYLTITWSEPGAAEHPMLRSPATASNGFPTRGDLVERYVALTGRDVSRLPWYQALALWKCSVFCEAIYGRHLRGEHDDPWAASLEQGVPRLIEVAAACLDQA